MCNKKIMKCPRKINKGCSATGKECNHAIRHKENEDCLDIRYHSSCPQCVIVGKKG